jgi:hypothetical protein
LQASLWLLAGCRAGSPLGPTAGSAPAVRADLSVAPTPATASAPRDTEATAASLQRLDALFGTSGPLPSGAGRDRVVAFVRDRMQQDKFYDQVLTNIFPQLDGNGQAVILMSVTEGSDAGGKFLYRFTPCKPTERIKVHPWWSFDGSEVAICRNDYRPETTSAMLPGGSYCEGYTTLRNPRMPCGCGDRLVNCAPPDIDEKLNNAMYDEPIRTAQEIIQHHKPFSDLLTANATMRSGWAEFPYARDLFYQTGELAFAEPEDPPKPELRARRSEYTGGILTAPVNHFGFSPRRAISAMAENYLCMPFASQNVSASETLKLEGGKLREHGLFQLASTYGCQNCHARLENGIRAFSGWTFDYIGERYAPAAQYVGDMQFYVRDHRDLRATGPATPEWFGRTLAGQPEFVDCVVRRVENFVYAGFPVPATEHARLAARFAHGMDFADLFEQVVSSWALDDAPPEPPRDAPIVPAGDPAHAVEAVHRILAEHCTSCHHDGADIPSFAAQATLDRRMLLRIGIYVDTERMPPAGRALAPEVKRELVQNVCGAVGAEACRRAFPVADLDAEPVRSGSEVLHSVVQRTGRRFADYSGAVRILRGTFYAPDASRTDDAMAELLQVLLAAEHCRNDHGSSPTAMAACTRTVLDPALLHTPRPPGQAHGHSP